jgi:hypothetical protein
LTSPKDSPSQIISSSSIPIVKPLEVKFSCMRGRKLPG